MEIAFAKFDTRGVSLDGFDCGEADLNHFLACEAADFGAKGLSATKLLVEREIETGAPRHGVAAILTYLRLFQAECGGNR